LFKDSSFNSYIGDWDVSNVTNMNSMFEGATSFNQNINKWNVSAVTNMNSMFEDAASFNQNLRSWTRNHNIVFSENPISATKPGLKTNNMFMGATSFEFKILTGTFILNDTIHEIVRYFDMSYEEAINEYDYMKNWNTSNVVDMSGLFKNYTSFNEDISAWNVSNVTNMESMFEGAISFNQPIGSWNVSKVTTINSLFLGATSFNSPVNDWNVYNLLDASAAFMNAISFNQDIYNWNMPNCLYFTNMFNGCIRLQASNLSLDVSRNFEKNNNFYFYMKLLIN